MWKVLSGLRVFIRRAFFTQSNMQMRHNPSHGRSRRSRVTSKCLDDQFRYPPRTSATILQVCEVRHKCRANETSCNSKSKKRERERERVRYAQRRCLDDFLRHRGLDILPHTDGRSRCQEAESRSMFARGCFISEC